MIRFLSSFTFLVGLAIHHSLTFWTLLVGVVAFVIRWYVPTFPMDNAQILSLVVFFLGLIGIYPTIKDLGPRGFLVPPVFNSLAFLELLAGLVAFVLNTVRPDAPITRDLILGVFVALLALFHIYPELRERNFL